jgi:hypothetical protein
VNPHMSMFLSSTFPWRACGACQHLCCESHMFMFLSFAFPWRSCGELANIISVLWIPTCSCVLLLIPLSRFFSCCCCCLRCSIPWNLPCFFHASKNSAGVSFDS